jgi:hypothetical protein
MYDRKHVLLTWGGPLPGGEQWSCGIRLASAVSEASLSPIPLSISDSFLADLMGSYVPAVKAFHSATGTKISASCNLTHVKAAAIGTDGKYLPGQVAMVESVFAPVAGGWGGSDFPNQITLAVTTTTAQTRGLAKMGRFYLPKPGMALQADGLIAASDAASVAGQAKAFIEAISDIPGIDIATSPGAAVMSKVGSGACHRITGVKVGRTLDTQRRRRRSLVEGYQATGVDQGAF